MSQKEIPDSTIDLVAKHINIRSNKNYGIPCIGNADNIETPQIFEIIPFDKIDDSAIHFFAIDGSYNSEQFYNGLSIGMYSAGYICYQYGKQIRVNTSDDPTILGKTYFPNNILVSNQNHLYDIYNELLTLPPVEELLKFWNEPLENVFAYSRETICTNLSSLLTFCQEILEIAIIYEISNLSIIQQGDYILRDGNLRPLQIKSRYLVTLGKYLHNKGVSVVAITKQTPIKLELAYTLKQIDNYLQDQLKPQYPFNENNPKRRKLCCWFEIPTPVLQASYGEMFIKKSIHGGRGFGLFFAARLDYVEKLQNYDWLAVDVNIFDAIPEIEGGIYKRDSSKLQLLFFELTRLTQEHYILGYPYPLADVHNLVSLKKDFKEEVIKRLKFALYKEQRMDNVDIENLFVDTHERF